MYFTAQKMQKFKLAYAVAFYLLLLSAFNLLIYVNQRNPGAKFHSFFIEDFSFPAVPFAVTGIVSAFLIFFRFFVGLIAAVIPLSFMMVLFIMKWSEFNANNSNSYFIYCYQGNKFIVFFFLTAAFLAVSVISILKNRKEIAGNPP